MKKMILLVAMSLACATAWAQGTGNEFGTTPEQQQLNRRRLNFLRDQVVREEWGMAAEYLHQLMNEVPAAHPAIYTLAIDMYLKRAKAATDPAQKAMLTDSLIMMHDKYVEYFTGRYPTHRNGGEETAFGERLLQVRCRPHRAR